MWRASSDNRYILWHPERETALRMTEAEAPALLEELRRAQAWVAKVAADYDGDGSGLGGRASKQLDRMVAVIAAATGEEAWR